MDDQHQEGQARMDSEDPTALLPQTPTFSIKKGPMIVIGALALLLVLAGLHYSMRSSTPIETTRETPNGAVVTITPQDGALSARVPEIVKDKDGREYLTGEIIVAFRASVPVEEAKKMVVGAGGVVKQHFSQFPVFLVGISEQGSEGVNKAILTFQTMPEVERAEPNYLTQTPAP